MLSPSDGAVPSAHSAALQINSFTISATRTRSTSALIEIFVLYITTNLVEVVEVSVVVNGTIIYKLSIFTLRGGVSEPAQHNAPMEESQRTVKEALLHGLDELCVHKVRLTLVLLIRSGGPLVRLA